MGATTPGGGREGAATPGGSREGAATPGGGREGAAASGTAELSSSGQSPQRDFRFRFLRADADSSNKQTICNLFSDALNTNQVLYAWILEIIGP